jgi:uncharacterized protein
MSRDSTLPAPLASIEALWRYPVKSLRGESPSSIDVAATGVVGDRSHALIDAADGAVVTAKDSRRWPGLFSLAASYAAPPVAGNALPDVAIEWPDGRRFGLDDADLVAALTETMGRALRIERSAAGYHDAAPIHLLSTSTLERLRELNPSADFDPRRFRPNLLVRTDGPAGFVEEDWIGKQIAIGEEVVLAVSEPCERCVMTTLAQPALAQDPSVLRTLSMYNEAIAGVYARVISPGTIRVGDAVRVLP